MTSRDLITPAHTIAMGNAATRRSVRISTMPSVDLLQAMELKKSQAKRAKRRRESNQLRGEKAVKIRVESEKKAKTSGEKAKSYEKYCEEASFLTDNAR